VGLSTWLLTPLFSRALRRLQSLASVEWVEVQVLHLPIQIIIDTRKFKNLINWINENFTTHILTHKIQKY
jgi:hypothetical protein